MEMFVTLINAIALIGIKIGQVLQTMIEIKKNIQNLLIKKICFKVIFFDKNRPMLIKLMNYKINSYI